MLSLLINLNNFDIFGNTETRIAQLALVHHDAHPQGEHHVQELKQETPQLIMRRKKERARESKERERLTT